MENGEILAKIKIVMTEEVGVVRNNLKIIKMAENGAIQTKIKMPIHGEMIQIIIIAIVKCKI